MQQFLNYSIFSHENGLPSILIYFVLKSKKALFYGLCKRKARWICRILPNEHCQILVKSPMFHLYKNVSPVSEYIVICMFKNCSSFKDRVTLALFFFFLHLLRSIVFDLLKKIIQFIFSSDCHIVVY